MLRLYLRGWEKYKKILILYMSIYSINIDISSMATKGNDEENKSKIRESETGYNPKGITFFDSLEAMNEHDLRNYARMTIEERFQMVLKMRNAIRRERKKSAPFGKHIYFKKV